MVPTDTCTVVNMLEIKSIAKTLTRAVAPEQAGREGVDFGITNEVGAEILNQFKPFPKDRMNVNFTLKVYVKFPPIPDETAFASFSSMVMNQHKNGSVFMRYPRIADNMFSDEFVYVPSDDLTNPDSDDGWIELVGIKMKVQNRRKRGLSSEWIMLGIDLFVHPGKIGHCKIYFNGKLVHSKELKGDDHILLREQGSMVKGVKLSCMEYSSEAQDASYFEDLNLNECSKSS